MLALDADPRVPVLVLARRLGLARRTVQTRLARLEDGGALRRYSDRVRPAALGFGVRAIVTAEVEQEKLRSVVIALAALPEILEVAATTGDGDLLCQVVAVDAEDLHRVGQHILECPGIHRTRTALLMPDLILFRTPALLSG